MRHPASRLINPQINSNISWHLVAREFQVWMLCWTVLMALVMSAAACRAENLMVGQFGKEGLAGWTPKVFQGETSYSLVNVEGRVVIRANSKDTASGLVKKITFSPTRYRYLKWSWKISHTLKKGNGKFKSGDDYAARIYVVFPGFFFWQTKAINYIWANRLPKGKSFPNAFTDHAMMIAVESGSELAGRWQNEERDILADYRSVFGSEPPDAEAIAIMTDTDNTGSSVTAWYGDITLSTDK